MSDDLRNVSIKNDGRVFVPEIEFSHTSLAIAFCDKLKAILLAQKPKK